MEKKQSFSIRKIGTVVGSFLIASTYFSTMVHADSVSYSYVDKQELTADKHQHIQTDNPTVSTDHYYLVYEKNPEQLPYTGFTTSLLMPIIGLSALAFGTILIAQSKRRKKWGALFIVTAGGILPFTQAYALENGLLAQYNQVIEATNVHDGIIHIDGYYYVGYLPVEQIKNPVSTESQTTNSNSLQPGEDAQNPTLSEKGESTTQEKLEEFPIKNVSVVTEKGTSTSQEKLEEFPIENVPIVTEKGTSTSQDQLEEFPIENVPVVTEKGTSTSQDKLEEFPIKNVPVVTEKGTSTSQEKLEEFPIENVPVVTEKGTSTSQEKLEEFPIENIPVVTEKGTSTSQDKLEEFPIENVPVVTEKGTSTSQDQLEVFPVENVPVVTEKGTSTSQDQLEEFPIENVPVVTEKGTSTSQEQLEEFPIKNVPVVTEKGASTSQEQLEEFPIENVPVVTEKGTSTSQDQLEEFPIENVPVVTEKGTSTSQEKLEEFPIENVPVVTEKGASTSQDQLEEFPIENVPVVTEKGTSTSQEKLEEFLIENVPVVTEKGTSTSQDQLQPLGINTEEHTQSIPVSTTNETSADLFEDETQTIEGKAGEEKITRLYVKNADGSNGDLLDETHVTLQEMIPTKVIQGTKVRQKFEELSVKNSLIGKFLPYYNLEYLDGQAKKLTDSNRITKEILSITPMTDTNFTPMSENANKIFVHYADGTKDEFSMTNKRSFNDRIDEYDIPELGITYTPRYKATAEEIATATQALNNVELYSNAVYAATKRTNPQNQQQFIQELYFDEAAERVKQELASLTPILLENGFTTDTLVNQKEKIFLGLTYLENYYNIQFGDYNLKNLLLTDFYGTKQNLANTLISLGGNYEKLRGRDSNSVFENYFAKHTQSKKLVDFFEYNRKLLTDFETNADWFRAATKDHVYIAERASNEPGLASATYKAYDKLQKGEYINYLLPILNLKKSQIYIISNYSTFIFGSKDRHPNKTVEQWKQAVDETADRVQNYLDTWYRISDDSVKNRLVRERNTPTWDGYNANGWADRFGRLGTDNEFSSIREFFGPIGKYFASNGLGAYAGGRGDTLAVHFIIDDVLSAYGSSVYSHEMTHTYDTSVFLGGYGRRDGMGAEAFARGLLEVPQNGGELGVNLLFNNVNDGNRWYNPTPQQFTSQADIDLYMKRYIDTKMAIDYAETDAVLKNKENIFLMTSWFKKMDKQLKANNRDQLDLVRDLNEDEKATISSINSIDDLIENNYITARSISNGTYDGGGIRLDAYVRPHTLSTFYGGNTSSGAAGAATFKYNAFHMWAYFGYSNGFVGYASNKYSADARKADGALNDNYIIQQISSGRFQTLEEWKKAYYAEVKERATTYFKPVTVDGQTFNTYEEVVTKINTLLQQANPTNAASLKRAQDSVHRFKEKLYKAWLKDTNGFQSNTIGQA